LILAALYDVHGNLPALGAVLEEVDRLAPDVLLFGGDVAAGPFPHETIELLRGLDARFVMGNADRTLIDGRLGSIFDWATTQVTDADKDFLRGFEQTIAIDEVLYCHSTPTSDEEWITILTPDELAAELLGEVGYPTLVQGHTHTQFDRMIGGTRVVNAGSVGMGNADEPGAHWLLVADGEPEHRRTAYDLDAAVARLRESEWPILEEWLQERVLSPLTPLEAAEMVEARRR
jgi:predicted phosphodiesterase